MFDKEKYNSELHGLVEEAVAWYQTILIQLGVPAEDILRNANLLRTEGSKGLRRATSMRNNILAMHTNLTEQGYLNINENKEDITK